MENRPSLQERMETTTLKSRIIFFLYGCYKGQAKIKNIRQLITQKKHLKYRELNFKIENYPLPDNIFYLSYFLPIKEIYTEGLNLVVSCLVPLEGNFNAPFPNS